MRNPRRLKCVHECVQEKITKSILHALKGSAALALAGTLMLPTSLQAQETGTTLQAIEIISATPIFGGEIEADKIPTPVTSISNDDFDNLPTGTIQNALQQAAAGAIVVDLQGSDFQNEIRFRGFAASPVNGVPQGIAVYQNGVRINEAFGDIVNLDFLPEGAIESMDLLTANPIFGLNAIGGSLNIKMRDGFNFQGVEIEALAGSFERRQGSVTGGMLSESGNFAGFVSFDLIDDDGYRDFSESEVRRVYADVGFKTGNAEFHVNYTGADNSLGVVAASPEPLLDIDRALTFTSPQITDKELHMVSLNGKVDVTPNLVLSGVAYYRNYKGNVLDGNLAEFEACEPDEGVEIENNDPEDGPVIPEADLENYLCGEEEDEGEGLEQDLLRDANGQPFLLENVLAINGLPEEEEEEEENEEEEEEEEGLPLGSIDKITQETESWGGSLQAAHDGNIFGLTNKLIVGGSVDYGETLYTARSEPGEITTKLVVSGVGTDIGSGGEFTPRRLNAENTYLGAYFLNVTDLTDKLTLSVGGRYNWAEIDMEDLTGDFPNLTTVNTYERFNPSVGATYEVVPALTFYGSYSEANRAPTAAELGCAEPDEPCPIESFLTDDPPLDQVVTRTYEAGIRGYVNDAFGNAGTLKYSFGYFHATNEDDILSIASEEQGRGYFDNVGDTRREGFEADIQFKGDRLSAYAKYSYTEATFLSAFEVPATGNPNFTPCVTIDAGDCVAVTSGDRIPGIPEHIFKAGFDFWITPKWSFGADLISTSDQIFLGDEGNVAGFTLAGYEKVDIRTSYNITDKVQIFGYIENVFDEEYGLFGNFFSFEDEAYAEAVAVAAGYDSEIFGDAETEDGPVSGRTIVPNKPVAAYVGVKIKLD